jgi:hypothetical protein
LSRTKSLPEVRVSRLDPNFENSKEDGSGESDPISLVEVRRSADNTSGLGVDVGLIRRPTNSISNGANIHQKKSQKQGGRSKPPLLGVPKFIQLAEAIREGGGGDLGGKWWSMR